MKGWQSQLSEAAYWVDPDDIEVSVLLHHCSAILLNIICYQRKGAVRHTVVALTQGNVPAELEGTLLRNGPGLFEIGERKISQPLDGDGQVGELAQITCKDNTKAPVQSLRRYES